MKKIILLLCSFSLTVSLSAQFGVTNGFQTLHAPKWAEAIESGYGLSNANVFRSRVYSSFDRAFQSRKRGIQFVPEMGFSRQEISIEYLDDENPFVGVSGLATDIYRGTFVSLMLNGDFFILRIKESLRETPLINEGNWLRDGLFLRFGVGVTQSFQVRQTPENFFGNNLLDGENPISRSFRFGVGLKLNISHFFTITPLVSATYSTSTVWYGLGAKTEYNVDPVFGFLTSEIDPNYLSPVNNYLQIMTGIRFEMSFKKMAMVKREK